MFMLIIAVILMELSYIGFQTVLGVTKAERLRMAAESGVEKAIQVLKDREGSVPSYPGNILSYSSPDGELKYLVEIYNKDQQPPYESMFYITSKVSTNDGRYHKSYVVRISKESFKSNFFTEALCSGGLTLIGRGGSSFEIPEKSALNIQGPLYLQCDKVNIKNSTLTGYRTIAIKAERVAMDMQPYDKYLVYADIPENNLIELNSLCSNYIKKCRLDYYNGIVIKSGTDEEKLLTEELFLIKRLEGDNMSFSDIENTWSNAKNSMVPLSAGAEPSILQKLTPDSVKQLSDYIMEKTTYKFVIKKGGLVIPDGEYNNYIICCSGKVNIYGNVKLNNSSILCTDIHMDEGSRLEITCPLRSAMQKSKGKISAELKSSMNNYSDGATVKFISWYDL